MYLQQLHQAWYNLSFRSQLAQLVVVGVILPTVVATQAIVTLAQGKFVQTVQGSLPIGIEIGDIPIVRDVLTSQKPLSGVELFKGEWLKRLGLERQANIGVRAQKTQGLPEARQPFPVGTYEIDEGKVDLVIVAVSGGVIEMDKFTQQVKLSVEDVGNISTRLETIIEQVQTLTPRVQQVSHGMEGQLQGAVQISDAMVQLSEASSQTAESLREINGAIAQLNDAAQALRQEISPFQVTPD